jgi:uridylate kinase
MIHQKYKRILLKISGESLMGASQNLFDNSIINNLVSQVKDIINHGVEVAIVIGGGNIFRGVEGNSLQLNKIHSDYMGMIATIINAIALNDFFSNSNIKSAIFSSIPINKLIKGYMQEDVIKSLANKELVIFAGGIGSPFFTTDSTAVVRAIEISADLIIKMTKVDGIYNKDPVKYNDAILYKNLTFNDAITNGIKVMDQTAFTLSKEHNIPILVCNMFLDNILIDIVINNKELGTIVTN